MDKIILCDIIEYYCVIDNNTSIIKKIIKDKKNIFELINIGKFIKNKNILSVILNNGIIDIYYLIYDKYYHKNYIKNYFNILLININNISYNAIIYDNNIYIPDLLDIYGKYELIEDLLIIFWINDIIYFNIKKNNIYIKENIDDVDIIFYQKQLNDKSIDSWYKILKHWYIYGKNNNILLKDESKININNKISQIIINHTHTHINDIDNNIYYKIIIDNRYLNINTNFFIIDNDNNIIFNTIHHKYTKFIKNNNVYEEAYHGKLIHPEYIKDYYIDKVKNVLVINNIDHSYNIIKNKLIININNIFETFYKIKDNENNYMKTDIDKNLKYYNKNSFSSIDENCLKIYNGWFESNNNNCYVITGIENGGAYKYINDLKKGYKNINFININSIEMLKSINFKDNEIILLQHLFYTNIDISDLIYVYNKNKLKLIITIHDWYWINDKILYEFDDNKEWVKNYLKKNIIINEKILKIFSVADEILCPSNYVYDIYLYYFKDSNLKIVSHNDCYINNNKKYIPIIKDNNINIGNLNFFSYTKGNNIIEFLKDNIKSYKNYNINFLIVGQNLKIYDEFEYYDIIIDNNIHCLTYLNNYSETYCYSLTKALNTGLCIIYNNIGAYIERIQKKDHYFKIKYIKNSLLYNDFLLKKFYNMLDYVIENNGKYLDYDISNNYIIYNKYYDNLFKNR